MYIYIYKLIYIINSSHVLNCIKILFNKYFQTKYLKKVEKKNFEQYQMFMYNFLKDIHKDFWTI